MRPLLCLLLHFDPTFSNGRLHSIAAVSTQCHCHPNLTLHQQYQETFSAQLEGNGKFKECAQDNDEAIAEVAGLESRRISV
jgi:hypothetical protein